MEKQLAFAFTILSLISVNLFAVEICNVVDHGNGEYTIQRTSRGVEHTFHRGVDGTWTELKGYGLAPSRVSQSFAKTLDSSLAAYILGKNAGQQTLPVSQAPQPLEYPEEHLGEEQPVEDNEFGAGIAAGEEDEGMCDPDDAARIAASPAHKRDFSGELAADSSEPSGSQLKRRKIDIDYAKIGRLALEQGVLPRGQQQQPAEAEVPAAQSEQPQREQGHPDSQHPGQPALTADGRVITLAEYNRHIAILKAQDSKDKRNGLQEGCSIQ